MDTLTRATVRVLQPFEDAFSERVWVWAQVLVVGTL